MWTPVAMQAWLIKNQGRFHTFMETELGKLKKQISTLTLGLRSRLGLPGGQGAGISTAQGAHAFPITWSW